MGTINTSGMDLSIVLIPDQLIFKYLYDAPGDYIKVILGLFGMSQKNKASSTKSLSDLTGVSEISVISALEYWDQAGIIKILSMDNQGNLDLMFINNQSSSNINDKLADSAPKAASMEMNKSEQELKALFDVIEGIQGTPLSPSLLNFIKDLKFDFKFEDEAIVVLFNFCFDKGKTTVPYMEKIALSWQEKKIVSGEDANSEIRKYEDTRKNYRDLFRYLGFDPGAISEPQENQMKRWYEEMGFSHEVIKGAAERCVSAIGKGDLNYIEGILNNWKKLGIKTVNDIEVKDALKPRKSWSKKGNHDLTSFNDYSQRDYTNEELEKIMLGWRENEE
ncbi:MAG: DnaD domain protein [Clostridiaceae bacterium]